MPALRPLLVGLTAAALIGLPGAATASAPASTTGAAQLGARTDTSIRFLDFDHTRRYGSLTVVRGQVATQVNGSPRSLRNARVELQRKLAGSSQFTTIRRDNTGRGDHPKFRFNLKTRSNATYKVVYAGNATYAPTNGVTVVNAYRKIKSTIEDGSGRFHGKLSPRYANKRVHLEKRTCAACGFEQVRSQKTNGKSKFSFKVNAPNNGQWWWRVTTAPTTQFIESSSAVFSTRQS